MPDQFSWIVDRIVALAAGLRATPHVEWGTVVSTAPLTVQLDGDVDPLLGSPSKLAAGLMPGERVFVLLQNRRATIIGRGETSEWVPITPGPGWTAVSGHTPRCRVVGGWLVLEGALLRGSGGALTNLGSIPAGVPLRGGKTVFIGGHTIAKGTTYGVAEVYLSLASRNLQISGYSNIDSTTGWVVPISGNMLADQT
ncbi:hypothetical protein ACWGOE_07230 [Leucobacter chromiiresistens]